VLAHELVAVKQFFSKYGNWIFGGLVAVLAVVLIVWYSGHRADSLAAQQNAQFNLAIRQVNDPANETSALASLGELAENAKNRLLAAQAAGFLGEFYSSKHQASVTEGSTEAADFMAKAKRYYEMVVRERSQPKQLLASAHMGLGTLASDAGDFATAKAEYEKAVKAHPQSPGGLEARRLLAAMEGRSGPVHIVTTLPTTAPATVPATGPAK
jgi:tetratricopeptide (TPR) repeat protein